VETGDAGLPLDAALRRQLEIVGMLRSAGDGMSPTAEESDRMKDRLFAAIAAEPVEAVGSDIAGLAGLPTDPAAPEPEITPTPAGKPRRSRKDRLAPIIPIGGGKHRVADGAPAAPTGSLARRFVFVSSAAAALIVALSSTGMVLSRDALPGDALYAMKRSGESASLNLTFGNAQKALKHLEFAAIRLDEVQHLVSGAGSGGANPVLVADTLREFDTQARTGSRMLLIAAGQGDTAQLGTLQQWADTQAARLSTILPMLPVSARSDGGDSLTLLNRMQGRADALKVRQACQPMTASVIDDLGPLPSAGRCLPNSQDPTAARTATPGGTPGNAPSNTPGTPDAQDRQLLPNDPSVPDLPPLLPEDPPLQVPNGDPNARVPASPPDGSQQRLPEISLPPLLPGLPGFTI
jgi:hypothetical protein